MNDLQKYEHLQSVTHCPHATDGAAAVVAASVQVACVAIVKV